MSALSPPLDPASLRGLLEPYSGGPGDPSPRPGGWLAAVSLVLRPAADAAAEDAELLIIKRSRHDHDPWSGHMALPGGRKEDPDASLLHTAIRETREEVGLDLDRDGDPLGRLDIMAPISASLPPLTVLPFVFQLNSEVEARISSPEVAEIHWVRLRHLRNPENRVTHRFRHQAHTRTFPAIDVEGRRVWGLTLRILTDFFDRLP